MFVDWNDWNWNSINDWKRNKWNCWAQRIYVRIFFAIIKYNFCHKYNLSSKPTVLALKKTMKYNSEQTDARNGERHKENKTCVNYANVRD